MTEINTFSALVDDAVRRTGRTDRRADIISYARATIRELQSLRFFRRDMTEDQLTATGDGYVWTYPTGLRTLRAVRYQIYNGRGEFIYPTLIGPSKKQREEDYYFYGGPGYYVFKGVDNGTLIDVAYYSYLTALPYYESGSRPATYSLEDADWSYLTASTDAEKEAARDLVTNWLIFDHYDFVLEGVIAKIFKTTGDERARSSFALYASYKNDLVALEPADALNTQG